MKMDVELSDRGTEVLHLTTSEREKITWSDLEELVKTALIIESNNTNGSLFMIEGVINQIILCSLEAASKKGFSRRLSIMFRKIIRNILYYGKPEERKRIVHFLKQQSEYWENQGYK